MFSFLSSCFNMFNPQKPQTNAEKRDISNVRNYAVYYGQNRKEDLEKFDMVIIQPHTFMDEADVTYLQEKGVKVIAYLSIGQADLKDPFYKDDIDPAWLLDVDPNWNTQQNTSYYADAGNPGWQSFILNTMIPRIFLKNFDGLFLDTVDTVDAHPDTKTGMVELIKKIRDICPDKAIIQNRGFSIFDHTDSYVDGILYETFTDVDGSVLDATTANTVKGIALASNITVFTLDYIGTKTIWHELPQNDQTAINQCINSAKNFEFIPYISDVQYNSTGEPIYLQTITNHTFDKVTW